MLFPKHPKSIDSLLIKGSQIEQAAENPQRPRDGDLPGNFFLIFSVQEVVDFKQDAHKLIRRLSTLCRLLSSLIAAVVALWLLDVLLQ